MIRPMLRLAALAALALSPCLSLAQDRAPTRDERGDRDPEDARDELLSAWPRELTRRPLTIPDGVLEVLLPVNANLSDGSAFEPTFLNPSVYYGVTPRLMVGVRHFVGVCVTGEDGGCPEVYDDTSVDAVWSFYRGLGVDLALGGALNAAWADDPSVAGELRVQGKLTAGRVAIIAAPQLGFGIVERDDAGAPSASYAATTSGFANREILTLPLTVELQLTDGLAVSAGTSLAGPLNPPTGGFGDFYRVPLGATAVYAPSSRLDLGASFWFDDVGGADGDADRRFAKVFATWRI